MIKGQEIPRSSKPEVQLLDAKAYSIELARHEATYKHSDIHPLGADAETVVSVGALVLGAAEKTTPVDDDMLPIMDTADSNKIRKLSWSNVKATLKSYFDEIYRSLSNMKFGTATDYTEFEADGTIRLNGEATGWLDIKFPQGIPKTTGAGNPTLVTYLGNQRGYAYAVNDVNDFDPQEYDHNCKVGAPFTWHLHLVLRANDASIRYLNFEIERSYLSPTGVETQITPNATAEFSISAGTTVLTGKLMDLITDTVPGIGPAWMLSARIKRIAASGTAPSVDPIIKALHIHAEVDTPAGSRGVIAK